KVVGDFNQVILDAEPPSQAEVKFLRQRNWNLFAEIGQRHVREQAEQLSANLIPYMIASPHGLRRSLIPARNRAAADADSRSALQRLDQSEQGSRPIDPTVLLEPRTEVGDLEGIAIRQRDGRQQDIGIRNVALVDGEFVGVSRARDRKVSAVGIEQ